MHDALKPAFNQELMRLMFETITVPRRNYAGVMERTRELPKISWILWKSTYSSAYKQYKAMIGKPAFPITVPKPIISQMAERALDPPASGQRQGSNQGKPKACKWCKSTAHDTCDCPSDERKNAGPCHAHQRGRCRAGEGTASTTTSK